MGWFEIDENTNPGILNACIQCFQNVSNDSAELTPDKLTWRLKKGIDGGRPKPFLSDGVTQDKETKMFRLFGYNEGGSQPILLTIALDRTLKRDWIWDAVHERYAPTGVPRRNHWCITLGIAVSSNLDETQTSDLVIACLKSIFAASNDTYQFALLWTQRQANASQELNADWSKMKGKNDAVFKNLNDRSCAAYPDGLPQNALMETAYAHWGCHLGEAQPPTNQIRFTPFKLK
ncbi:MAG: hypothetical protein KDB01_10515 [Planctomycetaceae bacterium]|nr:hypothetical protein [Planctomycetaceae bacterium]